MARRPDSIRSRDSELVQIVDAALEDSVRRSGPWLACAPGCTQCCIGVFAISQLDALRLQRGLSDLAQHDPERLVQVDHAGTRRRGARRDLVQKEAEGDLTKQRHTQQPMQPDGGARIERGGRHLRTLDRY